LALATSMFIAATVGTLIPLTMHRIGVDPAVATGPFVTTSLDVLGLLSYFLISWTLSLMLLQ
jgi:magnesium transporter